MCLNTYETALAAWQKAAWHGLGRLFALAGTPSRAVPLWVAQQWGRRGVSWLHAGRPRHGDPCHSIASSQLLFSRTVVHPSSKPCRHPPADEDTVSEGYPDAAATAGADAEADRDPVSDFEHETTVRPCPLASLRPLVLPELPPRHH